MSSRTWQACQIDICTSSTRSCSRGWPRSRCFCGVRKKSGKHVLLILKCGFFERVCSSVAQLPARPQRPARASPSASIFASFWCISAPARAVPAFPDRLGQRDRDPRRSSPARARAPELCPRGSHVHCYWLEHARELTPPRSAIRFDSAIRKCPELRLRMRRIAKSGAPFLTHSHVLACVM